MNDLINDLYTERAHLIAALTKLLPARKFEGTEEDFPVIIHIELPTGQAGWHIADADAHLFDHLHFSPDNDYDGHSTALKYKRLDRLEYSKPKIAAVDLIIGYGHVKVVSDEA